MRYSTQISYPQIAPNPLSYNLIRWWMPSLSIPNNRVIRNAVYNGGVPQDASSNGSDLILGTTVDTVAGAGPRYYSITPNGYPTLFFDGSVCACRHR
jgi:hypothetical protein